MGTWWRHPFHLNGAISSCAIYSRMTNMRMILSAVQRLSNSHTCRYYQMLDWKNNCNFCFKFVMRFTKFYCKQILIISNELNGIWNFFQNHSILVLFVEFAITCVISLVASIFLSVMKVGLLAMAFELILENHLQASTSISIH